MSIKHKTRRAKLLAVGLPLVILAAIALAIVLAVPGGSGRVQAATDPTVNFSISSTGCDSSGSPSATCTVAASAMFSVAVNLNHLPSNGTYDGYDASVHYSSGLTGPALSGLHQNGAGNWSSLPAQSAPGRPAPRTPARLCTSTSPAAPGQQKH
jgi:hypothetical protein